MDEWINMLGKAEEEQGYYIIQVENNENLNQTGGRGEERMDLWDISVQFSSVAQLCPTLCDPMNHSTPGLPVHHQLPEFTQTHAIFRR